MEIVRDEKMKQLFDLLDINHPRGYGLTLNIEKVLPVLGTMKIVLTNKNGCIFSNDPGIVEGIGIVESIHIRRDEPKPGGPGYEAEIVLMTTLGKITIPMIYYCDSGFNKWFMKSEGKAQLGKIGWRMISFH